MKRDQQICDRCLVDAVKKRIARPRFFQRRLDNGFCIYNVTEDGGLHPMLGEGTRNVPVKCPYAAEQAVTQRSPSEMHLDMMKSKRDELEMVKKLAVRNAWKFGIIKDSNETIARFESPNGKVMEVKITDNPNLDEYEYLEIKRVWYEIHSLFQQGTVHASPDA